MSKLDEIYASINKERKEDIANRDIKRTIAKKYHLQVLNLII